MYCTVQLNVALTLLKACLAREPSPAHQPSSSKHTVAPQMYFSKVQYCIFFRTALEGETGFARLGRRFGSGWYCTGWMSVAVTGGGVGERHTGVSTVIQYSGCYCTVQYCAHVDRNAPNRVDSVCIVEVPPMYLASPTWWPAGPSACICPPAPAPQPTVRICSAPGPRLPHCRRR